VGNEPIIRLIGVKKSFGDNDVLRGVDLDVPEGLITTIIGGSGSGKSVLIKHIIALLRPDEGQVIVDGQDVTKLKGDELVPVRRKFGMLFQYAALFDSMTVEENVAFPLREHTKLPAREIRKRVSEKLEMVNLAGVEKKYPAELSGGMRKRVGLARAIILQPKILIYDEPTAGLDPIMIFQVDEMIRDTQQRLGITSVVISHDMASTFRISNRIAMLHRGRIIETGTPEEVRRSEHPHVREFIYVTGTGPLKREHGDAEAQESSGG
jgi:phospholipid/cholesterol/gamma-HCH transport system ATP-binding protein